jgi:hypothetical protein
LSCPRSEAGQYHLAVIIRNLINKTEGGLTMGTKGREIVGMDVQQLLDLLNRAFADEWFEDNR